MENNLKVKRKDKGVTNIQRKSERFSIRKFKVGVGSTLLGTTLLLTGLGGDVLSVVGLEDTSIKHSNVVKADEVKKDFYDMKVTVNGNTVTGENNLDIDYKITIDNGEDIKAGDSIKIPVPYIQSKDGEVVNKLIFYGGWIPFTKDGIRIAETRNGDNGYEIVFNENVSKVKDIKINFNQVYRGLPILYLNDSSLGTGYKIDKDYPFTIELNDGTKMEYKGAVRIESNPNYVEVLEKSDTPSFEDRQEVLNGVAYYIQDDEAPSGIRVGLPSHLGLNTKLVFDSKRAGNFDSIIEERTFNNSVIERDGYVLTPLSTPSLYEYLKRTVEMKSEKVAEKDESLYFLDKGDVVEIKSKVEYMEEGNNLNHRGILEAVDGGKLTITKDRSYVSKNMSMKTTNTETLRKLSEIEDEINRKLHTFVTQDGKFDVNKLNEELGKYDFADIYGLKEGDLLFHEKMTYDGEVFNEYDVKLSKVSYRGYELGERLKNIFYSNVQWNFGTAVIEHGTIYVPSNNKEDLEKYGEIVSETEGKDGLREGGETVEEAVDKVVTIGNIKKVEEDIGYETKYEYTLDLAPGETRVKVEGELGKKEKYERYEVDAKDGKLSQKPVETFDEKVVKEPVTKIVEIGYGEQFESFDTIYTPKYKAEDEVSIEEINFDYFTVDDVIVEGVYKIWRGVGEDFELIQDSVAEEREVYNAEFIDEGVIEYKTVDGGIDWELKPGETKVTQEGKDGSYFEYRIYEINRENGEIDYEDFVTKNIKEDAIDEIVKRGPTLEELIEKYKEKLEETIEEYDNKIKELEEELGKTKEEVGNNKEEYEKEKAELEKKIEELEETHKKEIEELEKDFNDKVELINEDLTKKETELENLKEELDNQKQQNEEDKTLLEDRIKELEEEITKNKEDCAKTVKEIEDKFNEELEKLEDRLAEKEGELKELEGNLDSTREELEKEIADIKEDIVKNKEDCAKTIKEIEDKFNEELVNLQEELDKTNQELNELTERVDELEKQKEVLEEEISKIKEELSRLEESNKQELEKTKEEFGAIIEELKEKLQEKDSDIKEINDKIKDLEGIVSDNDKESKKREDELRNELDKLTKEKEELESKLKELEDSNKENKDSLKDLTNKIEELNKQLEDLDKVKADKTEVDELENKVEDLENNKSDKETDTNTEESGTNTNTNSNTKKEEVEDDKEEVGDDSEDEENYSVVNKDEDDSDNNNNESRPIIRDEGSNINNKTNKNNNTNSNVLPDTGINQESNLLVSGVALLMGLVGGLLLIRRKEDETKTGEDSVNKK